MVRWPVSLVVSPCHSAVNDGKAMNNIFNRYALRASIIPILSVLVMLASVAFLDAQARVDTITRPCPASVNKAAVTILKNGDIDIRPCSGRNVLLNGSPLPGGTTASGTSRTNHVPVWSSQTNLAKSPLTWDGSQYLFNDADYTNTFFLSFFPGLAGNLTVGNFTVYQSGAFTLGPNAARVAGNGFGIVDLGDPSEAANGTLLRVNDNDAEIRIIANNGVALVGTTPLILSSPATITGSESCHAGQIGWSASALYLCVSDDTWKFVPLNTF